MNSAHYNLRQPVTSIKRAISYLGNQTILSILINNNLGNYYNEALEGYQSEEGDLWSHSLRTAIAAKLITENHLPKESGNVAYTAGLLHDIGKIVISEFLNESLKADENPFSDKGEMGFQTIEKQILQTDHAEAGHMLAVKWKLPESLSSVIRYHHVPEKAPVEYRNLCVLVHAGDIAAMLGGYGTGCDTLAYQVNPMVSEVLPGLQGNALAQLLLEIDEEFTRTYNVIFSSPGENHV